MPVPAQMRDAFAQYRTAFALPASTSRDDSMPMVLSTRKKILSGVTDETAAKAIKDLFAVASDIATRAGDLDAAAALREASTHWLRYSMLTHHANTGVPLVMLRETAGHENLATTSTYLHTADHERHDALIASLETTKT